MKIDVDKSKYHEREDAAQSYDRAELKHLRTVLRRLRYLEQKLREGGRFDEGSTNGGALFDELEVEGLTFALTELDFLDVREAAQ